jgi:hypothetical protein
MSILFLSIKLEEKKKNRFPSMPEADRQTTSQAGSVRCTLVAD